jgi:hypothetical protein
MYKQISSQCSAKKGSDHLNSMKAFDHSPYSLVLLEKKIRLRYSQRTDNCTMIKAKKLKKSFGNVIKHRLSVIESRHMYRYTKVGILTTTTASRNYPEVERTNPAYVGKTYDLVL